MTKLEMIRMEKAEEMKQDIASLRKAVILDDDEVLMAVQRTMLDKYDYFTYHTEMVPKAFHSHI